MPDGYIYSSTYVCVYICACVIEGRVYNNNKRRPLCDIITICAGKHTLRLYCECSLKSSEDSYLAILFLLLLLIFLYHLIEQLLFYNMFCFLSSWTDETIIENEQQGEDWQSSLCLALNYTYVQDSHPWIYIHIHLTTTKHKACG